MIKYKFGFWILLLFGITCKAQYFGLALDSVNPYVTALPYPIDKNYRVLSYDQRFPGTPLYRTHIKVFDSLQQYVKTINLLRGITEVNDYPPLLHNNHLLWPAIFNDTLNPSLNSLVILELDTNYSFVALHPISTQTVRCSPSGLVRYSTGFVVGEYINDPNSTIGERSTKLFKLNPALQKKDSVMFSDELRLRTHKSLNNKIVGASENITALCSNTIQSTRKIVLDTSLLVIDCVNASVSSTKFCYDNGGNVSVIYPVKYRPKGIIFPLSNYRTYIHCELDDYNCSPPVKYKTVKSASFSNSLPDNAYLNDNFPDNTEFPMYLASSCDYSGPNTIYVATLGLKENYEVAKNFCRPYFAKQNTKISVTKQDTLGNMIWTYQYGGEMNYFARSVAFTLDGGCVVAGSRYDTLNFLSTGLFENFLMKLDPLGNVVSVGINENKSNENSRIVCFPNPARDYIQFKLPNENYSVEIYNNIGEVVLKNVDYVYDSVLDIKFLGPGVYMYRIISGNHNFHGKLLKY